MKLYIKLLLSTAVLALQDLSAHANIDRIDWSKGYVTGSFESNTNLYHQDSKSLATVPDGHSAQTIT